MEAALSRTITRRVLFGGLFTNLTSYCNPTNDVLVSVKSMEADLRVRIATPRELDVGPRSTARDVLIGGGPAISPDAMTIAWWWQHYPDRDDAKDPFVMVENQNESPRPVWLDGYAIATHNFGISSKAEIIVASVRRLHQRRRQLIALDLRNGLTVQDLTPFIGPLEMPDLEEISISRSGTRVAVGSRNQIQAFDIPSGKALCSTLGRFPRLSPDGARLALIKDEHLHIHSLSNDVSTDVLPHIQVMGIGHWSPDGRFLPAGAWTRQLAYAKRQIIIDSTTGQYAEISKLGEGDYGQDFVWVSTNFLR